MLKAGKARPVSEIWPKVGKPTGSTAPGGSGVERDSDGEEYQLVRRTETSLSDAIQAALDSYHKEPSSTGKIVMLAVDWLSIIGYS